MTRIFADPDRFVDDALAGFALANRDLVRRVDGGIVRARPLRPGQVAVIIGGGSGHYPAFAGFVGAGLAAGAVCGNIFSSPSTGQALRVAGAADAGGGVLFTYGKYAGDVIHFGEAERRLRADGVDARTVLITDDVASAGPDAQADRRGIAGILCVFRVAGAASERGDSIDEVERLARLANERTRSHGVAFAGCTLPGADGALFTVPDGMMSIGLGIHGEPGVRDVPMQSAPELAVTLLQPVLAERPEGAARAALIVNGLGTVKYEELFVLYGYLAAELASAGLEVVAPEVGELVTSLDMAGVSVTLMWLDDELEPLWTAAAESPAFRRGAVEVLSDAPTTVEEVRVAAEIARPRRLPVPAASVAAAAVAADLVRAARDAIAARVDELGALDAIAGDGDHGVGMVRGLDAAVASIADADDGTGVRDLLVDAGEAWSEVAGGTSGALWGAAIAELGEVLGDRERYDAGIVADAVRGARGRIEQLGGASVGDKTMLDAIVPLERALAESLDAGASLPEALREAADRARSAADDTAALAPKLGRARPLAERSIGHPDPGAVSFSIIVDSVSVALADRTEQEE
jgi:D-erythrulose 4-kinase